MPIKADYIHFIEKAYEREKGRLHEEHELGLLQTQASTPLFGYLPPRWMLDFAATCAFLFAQTGDLQLALQAKEALLFYREWPKGLPAEAVHQRPEYSDSIPPLEPVFHPVIFAPAVRQIQTALLKGELESMEDILADSLRSIWRFPEWGGHNRAMLRAAGLAQAAATFPRHPEAEAWTELADELVEESWGRWSIEDAMLYQAHWLRALILYAEARGRLAQLKELIQPRLQLKAIAQLVSPLGILPDYGDSHWLMHSHWEWIACLEWGAAAYHDPALKWAAEQIYRERQADPPDVYLATVASLGWKWCDDDIPASPPLGVDEALDDLVIKKIVWRTGWERQDSYACLNYRDEGAYGYVARDYLRNTLAVSAEKMHHGHADEGSFSMLVHAGTLLLHESGYRERPPDGVYRSAVYHNRLVWKTGKQTASGSLLEFLRGDGHYHPVQSERLYQTNLGDFQFSRIRVADEGKGLIWDRSIIFLPGLPCWIVVDGVLACRTDTRTLSALWWTTDILRQGEGWFETHIREIQGWQNRHEAALLISMPAVPGQKGSLSVEPFRRSFQDELALAHTWSGVHRAGRYLNFVSLLWPYAYPDFDKERTQALQVLRSNPPGRGIGLLLRWEGDEYCFGILNDLSAGIARVDYRPTYSTEQGLTRYGALAGDGAFIALCKRPQAGWLGFINGTFLSFEDRVYYQGQQTAMFQENATAAPGIPRRFRWVGKL